jgi:putative GTP pyrophosphokinase
MPSLDFTKEERAFIDFYTSHIADLGRAVVFFEDLIRLALLGKGEYLVSGRVKSMQECIRKFNRKYRAKLEESQTEYTILEFITDLIGVRVVCLYEDEIQIAVDTLQSYFSQIEVTDKIGKIKSSPDVLGYQAYHMDLELNAKRKQLEEYQKYADLKFEVQIRTVIQDAWSQIDHKIKYKKDLSPALERRINLLSGLFEIADREFIDIRDKSKTYIEEVKNTIVQIQSSTSNTNPLTAVELAQFLETKFPQVYTSAVGAETITREILGCLEFSIQDLINAFLEHQITVETYAAQRKIQLKPFTLLRHLLFLTNPAAFRGLLFENQRIRFESWFNDQKISAS